MAGSIWLPAPEVCREVGQIVPDNTRFCLFFVNKGKFWCCLASSGQLSWSFLLTSGPGSQIEVNQPFFGLAPSETILSGLSGLGVTIPFTCLSSGTLLHQGTPLRSQDLLVEIHHSTPFKNERWMTVSLLLIYALSNGVEFNSGSLIESGTESVFLSSLLHTSSAINWTGTDLD